MLNLYIFIIVEKIYGLMTNGMYPFRNAQVKPTLKEEIVKVIKNIEQQQDVNMDVNGANVNQNRGDVDISGNVNENRG